MMRVLQLGPYPPPHGGVQSNIVALRNFLLARGAGCDVVNLTRHRREERDGVYYPSTAPGVLRRLAGNYDILHLHIGGNLPLRLLGLALACAWTPGKRSVLTFHSGGYPDSPEGRSARPGTLRGFVFRRFDCIIGVNPEIV